ncbi:MAG: SMC-Scp complex subunit ScpB [Candidatus Omnitrophica bacterium]|nr:SMC-Scp complex subunit ScpB [Candidatus Omnitrophota bacterium]
MRRMDETLIKRILEALLFVSEKPLLIDQAREVLGPEAQPPEVRRLLLELGRECEQGGRGLRIVEVAEGFQMVTDPALAPHVARLTRKVRTVRLTRPSLETLAIVAYRQPATRVEIEQIRGVDVGGVLETLLKLSMIRVISRREVVGRPLLYGTTREFLDHFGLKSLDGLPSLEELRAVTRLPPEATEPFDSAVHPELVEGERPAQGERTTPESA